MTAFYNEIDPYVAQWLRNLIAGGLIAPGVVDTRSIVDVQPSDLIGYTQVHFFAGIGGWSLAARLAGWPDDKPLWTGSCPCQPFSAAGKRKGTADERHLWPEMRRLIAACRPDVVAGEQVASADGRLWLAGVRADLEDLAYEPWAADLCSAGTGAPHIRQRVWWLADSSSTGRGSERQNFDAANCDEAVRAGQAELGRRGAIRGLADSNVDRAREFARDDGEAVGVPTEERADHGATLPERSGAVRGMAYTDGGLTCDGGVQRGGQHGQQPQDGRAGGLGHHHHRAGLAVGSLEDDGRRALRVEGSPAGPPGPYGAWSRYDVVHCTDGKARRFESFAQPLVDGLPRSLGPVRADIAEAFEEEVNRYASFMCVDPGTAVRDLWLSLVEEAVQRSAGGSPDLHAPQVLLSFLRQLADQGRPLAQSLPRTGAEAQEAVVRSLSGDEAAACTSHRRGLAEQRTGQSSNAVHPLSPVLARYAQAAWGETHAANAAAVFPLAWNATNRVGRLRAYGNAINPHLAAEVLGAYLDGQVLRLKPSGVFA